MCGHMMVAPPQPVAEREEKRNKSGKRGREKGGGFWQPQHTIGNKGVVSRDQPRGREHAFQGGFEQERIENRE